MNEPVQYKRIREGMGIKVTKIGANRWVYFVRVRDSGIFYPGSNKPFEGKLRDLYAKFDAYSVEDLKFANETDFTGLERDHPHVERAFRIRDDFRKMLYGEEA